MPRYKNASLLSAPTEATGSAGVHPLHFSCLCCFCLLHWCGQETARLLSKMQPRPSGDRFTVNTRIFIHSWQTYCLMVSMWPKVESLSCIDVKLISVESLNRKMFGMEANSDPIPYFDYKCSTTATLSWRSSLNLHFIFLWKNDIANWIIKNNIRKNCCFKESK